MNRKAPTPAPHGILKPPPPPAPPSQRVAIEAKCRAPVLFIGGDLVAICTRDVGHQGLHRDLGGGDLMGAVRMARSEGEPVESTWWSTLTFWEKVDELIGTAANLAILAATTKYLGLW